MRFVPHRQALVHAISGRDSFCRVVLYRGNRRSSGRSPYHQQGRSTWGRQKQQRRWFTRGDSSSNWGCADRRHNYVCENAGALKLSQYPLFHSGTKDVDIRHHPPRSCPERGANGKAHWGGQNGCRLADQGTVDRQSSWTEIWTWSGLSRFFAELAHTWRLLHVNRETLVWVSSYSLLFSSDIFVCMHLSEERSGFGRQLTPKTN